MRIPPGPEVRVVRVAEGEGAGPRRERALVRAHDRAGLHVAEPLLRADLDKTHSVRKKLRVRGDTCSVAT